MPKKERKAFAKKTLSEDVTALAEAQNLLYAANTHSILLVFQAMDAAGKDGTIKHVMSGINPQGCQVYSFKHPSPEELDHNYLWRCMKTLPERGRIGIFNRSYYEEVLIVKVHPNFIHAQRIPDATPSKSFWNERYEDINNFEQHLARNGSKDEQRKRFLERIDDPKKHWKFNASDIAERTHWDRYMDAYEEAISATSTKSAPWYIIPADHKWITRTLVAQILVKTIKSLGLQFPEVTREKRAEIAEAKQRLESEG